MTRHPRERDCSLASARAAGRVPRGPEVWAAEVVSALRCPHDGLPFAAGLGRLHCPGGHSYDVAREGYVNLLLPRLGRGGRPGDSLASLRARRRFLSSQAYLPVARALLATVGTAAPEASSLSGDRLVLDLGCGEGYYTKQLAALPATRMLGLDISKEAVRLAAGADERSGYVVASSYQVPILSGRLTGATKVFAPASGDELKRLLRRNGFVVSVDPGPDHLRELKGLCYGGTVRPGRSAMAFGGLAGFTVDYSRAVSYLIRLTRESALDLFDMTPFAQRRPDKRALLEENESFEVSVDAIVSTLRPHH